MELNKFKNRQPFKVPEGYFAGIESSITRILPDTPASKPPKRNARIVAFARYTAVAAAMALALIMAITAFDSSAGSTIANSDEYYDNEYIDEILNSYPIDDYTFYCCLTGNEIN